MKLKANNIFKSYKGRKVVNDISLEVNQGEIVGLLGPNGAGKTTTFYMIVGLIRASVIASGLIFELPIIIFFLTKIGLVTPEIMVKYRKFALVLVLVLSAVITPPDIASQIIVAIPIVVLYQISIYISKFVLRKEKLKNEIKG